MCNCDKSKCVAICHYCKNYEDNYIEGEFSGVGVCNLRGESTEVVNSCNGFECHDVE